MSSAAAPPPPPGWTEARERSNRFALWLIAWIAVHLGRGVARLVLHPITLYYVLFSPTARRNSKRYLRRALGRTPTIADGYRHVHAFASVALDRIWFVKSRMDVFELDIVGDDLVDHMLTEGRGAFLLGAHFGSFEALHAVGASRPGLRVAMVMYPDNARMIHRVLQAVAPEFELGIIPIGQRGSTLQIRDWLDNGGLVGLLGDRFLDAEAVRNPPVMIPFLGVPAPFSDGPLRLAMLLKRKIVFMVSIYRGGNRYDLRFDTLVDFSAPPNDPAERERLVHAALVDYAGRLEALARSAPYNWFNFHDFWHED
jgi:predicted LPLAT superfamily acyltransferase